MSKLIPTFFGKVDNGKLTLNQKNVFELYIGSLSGDVEIVVKKKVKIRSDRQNRALHLWFSQLAQALNDEGQDMRAVISEGVDMPWSDFNVKEFLFRPTMKTMLGKDSTKNLKSNEIDEIVNVISKVIGERAKIYIPFPSIENMN